MRGELRVLEHFETRTLLISLYKTIDVVVVRSADAEALADHLTREITAGVRDQLRRQILECQGLTAVPRVD